MFATYAQDRYDLQQSIDKGNITVLGFKWKVEYLPPSRLDLQITRDFYPKLLYFYERLYEESSVSLLPRIDKHVRCLVNGLTLSSDLNGSNCSSIVNPLRTVVTYMRQGNIYFTMRKQIIVTSPAFTL